jgi:hypothetical protein
MSLRTLASPAHEYMGLARTWTPRSFPLHSELIGAIVGRLTSFSLTWPSQHAQIEEKLYEDAKDRRRRDGHMKFQHDFGEVCCVELAKVLR